MRFLLSLRLAMLGFLSHRVKSAIVGSIVLVGAFLVVLGAALLRSIETSMQESITSSLAGHIQVYAKDARDKLALFGSEVMGAEDVGYLPVVETVRTALLQDENVKVVVPMGVDMATVTSPAEIEDTLARLRDAVRAGDDAATEVLAQRVREIVAQMLEEEKRDAALREEGAAADSTDEAILAKAAAPDFWARFRAAPEAGLEFLDTQVAPLADAGRIIYFRYLGTDLPLFDEHFDRFEVVRGKMVPPNQRGFLFNQKFYDDWVKNFVARGLDRLHRGVIDEEKRIKDDAALQALARQIKQQYRRVTYQLDAAEVKALVPVLREALGSDATDIDVLVQQLLTVDDENLADRYALFYEHIAPRIRLYAVAIGDVMTVRAFTRSGFLKSLNIRVYGTFRFKGLEKSELAGNHSLMDILSFRELYGLMTPERARELSAIRDEVGLSDVPRADAEAELFGAGTAVVEDAPDAEGFDEFAGMDLAETIASAQTETDDRFRQKDVDSGLALNAAVILKDPSQLEATVRRLNRTFDERGLNLQAVDWRTASGLVGQFLYLIRAVLFAAMFIVFSVALVIINNAVLMSTMERVTEIGTMRAIGARRGLVMAVFALESTLLAMLAGLVGAALGFATVRLLGMVGIPASGDVMVFLFGGPRLYPTVDVGQLLFALLVVFVVSLVSTGYPSWMATRVQPVVAMRAKE